MHDDCKTSTVTPLRYAVWHCSGEKRRNIEATLLAKGLAREREKEVAEAKARGESCGAIRGPTIDDEECPPGSVAHTPNQSPSKKRP
jgi:hypothetical protein